MTIKRIFLFCALFPTVTAAEPVPITVEPVSLQLGAAAGDVADLRDAFSYPPAVENILDSNFRRQVKASIRADWDAAMDLLLEAPLSPEQADLISNLALDARNGVLTLEVGEVSEFVPKTRLIRIDPSVSPAEVIHALLEEGFHAEQPLDIRTVDPIMGDLARVAREAKAKAFAYANDGLGWLDTLDKYGPTVDRVVREIPELADVPPNQAGVFLEKLLQQDTENPVFKLSDLDVQRALAESQEVIDATQPIATALDVLPEGVSISRTARVLKVIRGGAKVGGQALKFGLPAVDFALNTYEIVAAETALDKGVAATKIASIAAIGYYWSPWAAAIGSAADIATQLWVSYELSQMEQQHRQDNALSSAKQLHNKRVKLANQAEAGIRPEGQILLDIDAAPRIVGDSVRPEQGYVEGLEAEGISRGDWDAALQRIAETKVALESLAVFDEISPVLEDNRQRNAIIQSKVVQGAFEDITGATEQPVVTVQGFLSLVEAVRDMRDQGLLSAPTAAQLEVLRSHSMEQGVMSLLRIAQAMDRIVDQFLLTDPLGFHFRIENMPKSVQYGLVVNAIIESNPSVRSPMNDFLNDGGIRDVVNQTITELLRGSEELAESSPFSLNYLGTFMELPGYVGGIRLDNDAVEGFRFSNPFDLTLTGEEIVNLNLGLSVDAASVLFDDSFSFDHVFVADTFDPSGIDLTDPGSFFSLDQTDLALAQISAGLLIPYETGGFGFDFTSGLNFDDGLLTVNPGIEFGNFDSIFDFDFGVDFDIGNVNFSDFGLLPIDYGLPDSFGFDLFDFGAPDFGFDFGGIDLGNLGNLDTGLGGLVFP